jgi:hypothetical protein
MIGHREEALLVHEIACREQRHSIFLLVLRVVDEREAKTDARLREQGASDVLALIAGDHDGLANAGFLERSQYTNAERHTGH